MLRLENRLTTEQINKLLSTSPKNKLLNNGYFFKRAMFVKLVRKYTGVDINHSLVDGEHLIKFYEWLEDELKRLENQSSYG